MLLLTVAVEKRITLRYTLSPCFAFACPDCTGLLTMAEVTMCSIIMAPLLETSQKSPVFHLISRQSWERPPSKSTDSPEARLITQDLEVSEAGAGHRQLNYDPL